jgi:hypothetical protein
MISPGSLWTGAILRTSFIGALQRGHARVPSLFSNADTNAFHRPQGVERQTCSLVASASLQSKFWCYGT